MCPKSHHNCTFIENSSAPLISFCPSPFPPLPTNGLEKGRRRRSAPSHAGQAASARAKSHKPEFILTSSGMAVIARVRMSRLDADRLGMPPHRTFSWTTFVEQDQPEDLIVQVAETCHQVVTRLLRRL